MSLPGAGTGPSEQPTILVINQVNGETTRQEIKLHDETGAALGETKQNTDQCQQQPSETHSGPEISLAPPTPTTTPSTPVDFRRQSSSNANVLDIESHLIEDVNDVRQVPEASIGINELLPSGDELTHGSSKIETETNVRTVIEVEPAGVVTKQVIKTPVTTHHQIAEVAEEQTTLPTVQVTEEGKPELETDTSELTSSTADEATEIEKIDETAQQVSEALIRQTAEDLVNEIERELIEQFSNDENVAKLVEAHANEEDTKTKPEQELGKTLSAKVDAQLTELTSILKSKPQVELLLPDAAEQVIGNGALKPASSELKIVEVPTPKTAQEEEQRKLFIDSLPQIEQEQEATDASRLSADCKREYYQSLKKYLLQSAQDKPPVPAQTYRWEDLKRAKERGGYPWTHLYKRPLGPDEEPEIVLLLRKSQELRFTSESPKSLKKVRYDEQVLVKETERYIQDLTDDDDEVEVEDIRDDPSGEQEDTENQSDCISCVSDSVLAVGGHSKPRKTFRLTNIKNIIKRRRSGRTHEDAQSLPGTSANTSRSNSQHDLAPPPGPLVPNINKSPEHKATNRFPIMKKLRSYADRQKKRLNIKRIALKKDEKIVLGDETKILRLKSSPKCDRGEIPHFIEKQDSDEILELVEYDESPSRKRNKSTDYTEDEEKPSYSGSGIVQPDEIIELPSVELKEAAEIEVNQAPVEAEIVKNVEVTSKTETEEIPVDREDLVPPPKAPRLRREHVYEEIGQAGPLPAEDQIDNVLVLNTVDALKKSLTRQDNIALHDIETANKSIPLDRMGSSEEEQVAAAVAAAANAENKSALLAPISSIDSASSDEVRQSQLSPVAEESDVASVAAESVAEPTPLSAGTEQLDLKPTIKKEPSPAPSDKKVTFSHIEDEAEPHREDIELPEEVMEAVAEAANNKNKWKSVSDHEYEPISVPPPTSAIARETSPAAAQNGGATAANLSIDVEMKDLSQSPQADSAIQRSEPDVHSEFHSSQLELNELDEPPLKPEVRKKGFMASAQDRTRRMQDGLRSQAGKIRTKLRPQPKKSPSSSPKAKERRRFKAPEFSKLKMPEIKRPDMSKFKDIKRPEFTKFNKPDMSKFKLPEKFPTLKLRRSKSFKENEASPEDEDAASPVSAQVATTAEPAQPQKKMFEFNFGTYPRAFRKKKKPVEVVESSLGTEGPSIIPSTETQPSLESSSSPQGDRGPGPVRSRWADKFSDVSYNDSEGSRYRRYGSELESFDRESSLERRMKDDLEDTGSEAHDVGIIGGVADSKQFAEFDEENRAIHEISNLRSREFKRRPIVHQDSDLRSEDSKDVEGWTEKEIQKNKLLRKAEMEAEASYYKHHADEGLPHDAISTASSGKKVVMEEIDDDEFFLRKRGISEDNIQIRQYISEAIREGYDMPNALVNVGQASEEQMEYGEYDVPPPKPRRLHKNYRPEYDDSQEFHRSDYGDDYSMSQNGSDFLVSGAPKRPLRKGRSRSKYSIDSQDIPMADGGSSVQYFDDDEEYLRPPTRDKENIDGLNNLNIAGREDYEGEQYGEDEEVPRPQPPRRRQKKRARDDASVEKDAFINGFGGRSVSNTFLQPQEDVIIYRTEHEYHIPLATPENYTPDGASASSRKTRSTAHYDDDDHTSRGADSLAPDAQAQPEDYDQEIVEEVQAEKYIIDMMENDGYAVVRKEHVPKPTPPTRRKKFMRSPGERFATLPSTRTKRSSPAPERPPPPQSYTPSTRDEVDFQLVQRRHDSAVSLEAKPNYEEDDYEEPEALERPESPRNLQSGEIINKMKFRPLPPPPRPPREKRQVKNERRPDDDQSSYRYEDSERIATSSTADSYDQNPDFEVEVSTQTDPLPDDFVCEEFEITEDMKVIEPRRTAGGKTLDDLLNAAHAADEVESTPQLTEDEQLVRGLQRFRDANQRSMSERSRASSQADRSKSLSRPQTPSAIVIERRVSTPAPSLEAEATVAAALIVRPISDADLEDEELRREEEELRREGLLSDSSVQSKSDVETPGEEEEQLDEGVIALSDYAPSSADLDAAVEKLQLAQLDSDYETRQSDAEVERTLRDSEFEEDDVGSDRYAKRYDEDDEPMAQEDDWAVRKLIEQELEEALEKELQEEMEKELSESTAASPEQLDVGSGTEIATTPDMHSEFGSDVEEKIVKEIMSEKTKSVEKAQPTEEAEESEEPTEEYTPKDPIEPPQPPPRRKSTTVLETIPTTQTLTVAEQPPQEVTPLESVVPEAPATQAAQLPSRLGDLEVERLRVHALQAGQIMVSQLHGQQISADELECKSGNLVVQNIELPPGFIEDIVERVRSSDTRAPLLTVETQTSRQPSSEPPTPAEQPLQAQALNALREHEPPQKPPRQTKLNETATTCELTAEQQRNLDEETQTEAAMLPLPPPPPVYPSVEYLQSLAPLAFYNLQRSAEAEVHDAERKASHKCRRRHVQRRRSQRDVDEADLDDEELHDSDYDAEMELVERPVSRRSRTRSATQPPLSDEPKTVVKAGRQFISACSLELVNIINQLTNFVRGGNTLEPTQSTEVHSRHIPALMVLFMVITFGLLIFLLTGRNVHTHHWDYFNPPGNEGRQT